MTTTPPTSVWECRQCGYSHGDRQHNDTFGEHFCECSICTDGYPGFASPQGDQQPSNIDDIPF